MKKEIKIPDIAENVETGTIAAILVSKGDKVTVDQPLVEIETDKASTDIPSLYEGVVVEVKVEEGDEVSVNQVIMIIETEGDGDEESGEKDKAEDKTEVAEDIKDEDEVSEEEEKEDKDEEPEKEDSDRQEDKKEQPDQKKSLNQVAAAPSVRRIAREMEVDLTQVEGTGPGGRVTADDVKGHAGKSKETAKEEKPAKEQKESDFSKWGPVTVEKIKTIRRLTAETVSQSWETIPHVTHFDEADITKLENFRKQYQKKVEKEGVKLTVTSLLLKITGFALQKFPMFNASIGDGEIIYKHYYNIGVAVDTPRGLLVPVIRDVTSKSLVELSAELDEMAQKARDKKISPDEMQGGNFSISNLGGIGGTGFTPIVLPQQVAILGVSRGSWKPVYVDDVVQKRMIIPLSVSYDHRIIDGADGARFLRWICNVIEDPYAILL